MTTEANHRGLTAAQVEESRALHGSNVLTPPKRESVWMLFLKKFTDPLIIILLIAGFLSIGISFYEFYGLHEGKQVFIEPVGIFMAIILATALAFIFEYRAEKEFAILNKVSDDEPVQAVRDGHYVMIPRRDVVVGDIVVLDTGQEVPADGRLLEAVTLNIDESTLTGEPICHKTTDPEQFDPDATYASDSVMRGTKVMEGHGLAQITAVGDATENGKVFTASMIDKSVKTPLNIQLNKLGRLISIASYVIGSLVIVGRVVMYIAENGAASWDWMAFAGYFLQSVMLAVTLVVVAVPEGLPMAVTLSLAYSMRRMLKTGNLVRKMHACETMGAVTTICTDKTGTLTRNQMRVEELATGRLTALQQKILEEGIAVNSTANIDLRNDEKPQVLGNPTEGALLLWLALERGADISRLRGCEIIRQLPFSTENKYMATVYRSASEGGKVVTFVKGAPEIVLSRCSSLAAGLTREEITRRLGEFQAKAMRTLAFAYVEGATEFVDGALAEAPLTFLGIAAISDPVRDEVPAAVRECLDAGINVKIVTGDTPATAREIGRRIGLWQPGDGEDNIVTGPEIEAMTDEELRRRAPGIKIIARARPMDKKRLVEALQSDGEVVAVTGDGTNDAPALKAAHVGLSMGDGTSVAKEASDITIVSNSFAGISNAVMWGRSLYRNIQRFLLFQLTVNVAACATVLAGAFMGTEPPLTVTQMLWVNLVMDTFAAMALASLPPTRDVMNDPPRSRKAFIINRSMADFIVSVGLLFAVVMIGLLYIFEHASISSFTDIFHPVLRAYKGLSPAEHSLFFTIFVMLQWWNLFNARSFESNASAFDLRHCSEFITIIAIIFTGQILITTFGGLFFNVTALSLTDWLWILGCTAPVLAAGEICRLIRRMK